MKKGMNYQGIQVDGGELLHIFEDVNNLRSKTIVYRKIENSELILRGYLFILRIK